MHVQLSAFIKSRCHVAPAARVPLVEFIDAFHQSLPARDRESWRRGRIVAELAKQDFAIGRAPDNRYWLAGLSLAGTWQAVDGQLEFKPGRLTTAQNYVS